MSFFRYTIPMVPEISAVAFDLDGTLYPNYRLYIRLLPFLCGHWPLVAALARARTIIRREQEQFPAASLPDFYVYQAQVAAKLLGAQPEQIQEKIDRLIYRSWEPHFLHIRLFPHVRELLAELRAAKLKLGLLSDFPPRIKLENLGLDGCFDALLCSESVGALKPALQPFKKLADMLECPPEQVLYVGNSRHYDVAGAQRTGMKTALISGKYMRRGKITADFCFHDYRQLRNFVL